MTALGALVAVGATAAFLLAGLQMLSINDAFFGGMGIFSIGMSGLTLLGGIAVDRLIAIADASKRTASRPPGPPSGWGAPPRSPESAAPGPPPGWGERPGPLPRDQ
jgi:hypothetical protein